MSDRLIVVSDLHVGRDPAGEGSDYNIFAGAEEFQTLCRSIGRGEHLVLNGDAFDFLLDDEELDLALAIDRAKAILDGKEGTAVIGALKGIRGRGGEVTLRVGNHDPELGLQTVQDLFKAAVPGMKIHTGEAEKIEVAGVEVLVAHGELDDGWNRFDHEVLPRGERSSFVYPPGSRLVKALLNGVKREYGLRFADLLKPDVEGALLAVLAITPEAAKYIGKGEAAKIIRQLVRRRSAPYGLVGAEERLHRGIADLNGMAADALRELIEAREQEGFLGLFNSSEEIHAAWLRAAAALQRWCAGDKGEAFMSLDPEVEEWDLAQCLAAAHDVNVVLLGHTHAARIGQFGGLTIANSGTWIPLMSLPRRDAPFDEWVALLRDLREDRGLTGNAGARLIRRFTAVEVKSDKGGTLKVELLRQIGNERIPLGSRLVDCASAPLSAMTVDPQAKSEDHTVMAHRIAGFEAELDAWANRNPRVSWAVLTSRDHLDVLLAQARAALAEARDHLEPSADSGREPDEVQALRSLVEAQGIWRLYRTADAQRRDPRHGPRLQHADAVAFDGYRFVLTAAQAAGLELTKRARRPVPLVYLEPTFSPATYRRGAKVPVPALSRGLSVEMRFPVILVPEDHLAAPWWLTVLLHEVGHDLDHDLGLSAPISAALGQRLRDSDGGASRLDRWRYWLSEILADVIGLHLAGPSFVVSLREIAEPLIGWRWRVDDVHPPLAIRLDLLYRILTQTWELPAVYENSQEAQGYRDDLGEVIAAVMGTRLQSGPTTLAELLPKGEAFGDSSARWRSLPAAIQAQAAAAKEAHHSDPKKLRAALADLVGAFDRAAAELEPQEWQVPANYYDFIDRQVPLLAPTILEPGSLYKIPPLELLRRFDEAWFVGATNGQLMPRIEQAFVERGRKRWRRLVFFSLSDAGLRELAESNEERAAALIAERDAARAALMAVKSKDYAETLDFAEIDAPVLFASFWRGGGVRHVHVSAKVWGLDIRRSPAVDYRAVEGQENPQLEAYFEGLAALCRAAGIANQAP